MEKLFTVSEVAKELGRSTDWLRDAERRRKLFGGERLRLSHKSRQVAMQLSAYRI
jgi:hypothetical protein